MIRHSQKSMSVPLPAAFVPPGQILAQLDLSRISTAASVDFLKFFIHRQPENPACPTDAGTRAGWTQEEDEILSNAATRFGAHSWKEVAETLPGRNAKQCRERWFNRLNPQVKKGPFEAWEDHFIMNRQHEIGNRWSVIAQELPGRTASGVKNRGYSSLRTMEWPEKPLPQTECPKRPE
jgi:hypothetical protein